MHNIFASILKRGFYASLKNNYIEKTPEQHFQAVKKSFALCVSFCLIFMPVGGLIMLIIKLNGGEVKPSSPFVILIAVASIYIIDKSVKKYLDTFSLSDIEEKDPSKHKTLGGQYIWIVLGIITLMVFCMFLIRVTYLG